MNEFVTAEEIARFQYVAEKELSSLHVALSDYIAEVSSIEVTPKQVQALLAIHGTFQKSEANKNRAEYRARTVASIGRGGKTTAERYYDETEGYQKKSEPTEEVLDAEVVSVTEDDAEAPVAIEAPVAPKPGRRARTRKAKVAA